MSEESIHLPTGSILADQLTGAVVDAANQVRLADEIAKIARQDAAFDLAVKQIDDVRSFLASPGNILGSTLTKHGEIAEHVDVGIRNAREALHQMSMTSSFEGVGRLAPVDYIIDGVGVQSKFINGISNNLQHVLGHLGTYEGFTGDGSYYVIPKDTHEAILKLLAGENLEGYATRTQDAIKALVQQIEAQTGKPFADVVQPSVVGYSDVQIVRAPMTLDNEQANLSRQNDELKDTITQQHQPSLQGAVEAAAIAGAVSGAISFGMGLYGKYKAGKNVFRGEFTPEDWKDVGIDAAKGAAGGAFAGGALYLLTNYADMSAPFAAALVSAAKGIASLVDDYRRGVINLDQFVDLGMVVCAESALVGVAATAGQFAIPIPILGGVIGSMAGRMLTQFVGQHDARVAQRLRDDLLAFKAKLDEGLQRLLEVIVAEFDRLTDLTVIAFDLRLNTSLIGRSSELAVAYGVSAELIIVDEKTLDDFMRE